MRQLKCLSLIIIVGFFLMNKVEAQENNKKWHSSFSVNTYLHKNLLGSQYSEPDSTDFEYPNVYFYNIKNQFHFDINYHLHFKLNEKWTVSSGLSMYNSYVKSILNADFVSSLPENDVSDFHRQSIFNNIFTSIPTRIEYHVSKIYFYADFKPIIFTIAYAEILYSGEKKKQNLGIKFGSASTRIEFAPTYSFGIIYTELIDIKNAAHLGLNASFSLAPQNYFAKYYFSTGIVLKF